MVLSPNWCVLCKSNSETTTHIFIYYPYGRHIWNYFFGKDSSILGHARYNHEDVVLMKCLGDDTTREDLLECLIHGILWGLWKK